MVDEECQQGNWHQEKLYAEGVMVPVVGGLELDVHEVKGGV